ncbi:MAG: GNAT family N-acetyltransferase [Halolamina sp.]
MSLAPSTVAAVRRYWADRLGCRPAAFERTGVTLAERPDGRTIRLLRRGNATVVSAPEGREDQLSSCRDRLAQRPLTDVDAVIQDALADGMVAHGPAVLGYVDTRAFSATHDRARLLGTDDEAVFEHFRERVPDHEWARASPTFRPDRTAGLFRDGDLVALATLGDSPFADVGVVVAPEWRNEGLGQEVVSCVVAAAFERDPSTVARYRTPETESASLALAASLGFKRWASEVVVALE